MIKQEHFCKNCIIPEGFLGLKLDEEGLCDYCRNPSHKNANWSKVKIDSKKKKQMKNDWRQVIKSLQKTKRNGR